MSRNEISSLYGIRFFAILGIILLHIVKVVPKFSFIPFYLSFTQFVSLFFILSGFILRLNYPRLSGKKTISMFYAKRLVKIWPLHILTTLFAFVFISSLYPNSFTALTILSNLFIIHAWIPLYDLISKLNSVSWFLSVLLFCYILYPYLLKSWRRHKKYIVLFSFFSVIVFIFFSNFFKLPSDLKNIEGVATLSLQSAIYTNPLVRLFEFVLGFISYDIYIHLKQTHAKKNYLIYTMLEFLLVIFIICSMRIDHLIFYSLNVTKFISSAGAMYIYTSGSELFFMLFISIIALEKGIVAKFLQFPIFVSLGRMGFSIYVIHYILLFFLNERLSSLFTKFPLQMVSIYLIILLFCSTLSYYFLENSLSKFLLGKYKKTWNS